MPLSETSRPTPFPFRIFRYDIICADRLQRFCWLCDFFQGSDAGKSVRPRQCGGVHPHSYYDAGKCRSVCRLISPGPSFAPYPLFSEIFPAILKKAKSCPVLCFCLPAVSMRDDRDMFAVCAAQITTMNGSRIRANVMTVPGLLSMWSKFQRYTHQHDQVMTKKIKHHQLSRYVNRYTSHLWARRIVTSLLHAGQKAREYNRLQKLDTGYLQVFTFVLLSSD